MRLRKIFQYFKHVLVFNKKLNMLNCKRMKTNDARRAIDHLSHSGGLKIEKKRNYDSII